MAGSRRVLELAFAIGGKLNPTFARAAGDAGKQIEKLAKKSEVAAKAAKLQREQAAQMRKLQSAANNMNKAWGDLGKSITGPIKTVAKWTAVISAAGYGVTAWAASTGSATARVAKDLRIPVEAYSSLESAAKGAGIVQDKFGSSMSALDEKIVRAFVQGDKSAQEFFKRLGVSYKNADGTMKTADQLLPQMADVVKQMPDGMWIADLVKAGLGDASHEMIEFLRQGGDEIKRLQAEARASGNFISTDDARNALEFTKSLNALKDGVRNLGGMIGKELLPVITPLQQEMVAWMKANQGVIRGKIVEYVQRFKAYLPKLQEDLIKMKYALIQAWQRVDALAQSMGGWEQVIKYVVYAWATLKALNIASAFGGAIRSALSFIKVLKLVGLGATKLGWVIASLGKGFLAVIPAIAKFAVALLANPITWIVAGIAVVIGGLYMLWKHWDKVSAGVKRFCSEMKAAAIEGFKETVDAIRQWPVVQAGMRVWGAFTGWFDGVCANIKSAFGQGVVAGITALLGEFNPVPLMLKAMNGMVKAIFGIDLLAKGKEWFQNFIEGMLAAIRGIGSQIKDAIMDKIPSIDGITSGIKGAAGSAIAKVKGVLPKFGNGGIVTRPQVAMVGDGGPEAIIPLSKPSRAMELLYQTAKSLGMKAGDESPAAALSNAVSVNNSRTSVGGQSFSFAPNITVTGVGDAGAIKQAVTSAVDDLKKEFERWARSLEYQNARVAMR